VKKLQVTIIFPAIQVRTLFVQNVRKLSQFLKKIFNAHLDLIHLKEIVIFGNFNQNYVNFSCPRGLLAVNFPWSPGVTFQCFFTCKSPTPIY
jgi:hypothetical protein